MTTATMTRSRSGGGLIFLLLVAVGLVWMVTASWHAVVTHGPEAITAENCFNGKGQVMQQKMIDPISKRQMSFCKQEGKWFISIDAPDGGNVTMFPRKCAKFLQDVMKYAWDSGFTRVIH